MTMKRPAEILTYRDREFFEARGVPIDEVERQWGLLNGGFRQVLLDRPCKVDDGVEQLAASEHRALIELHREAASEGRWLKFVPASGAASRMFVFSSDDDRDRFSRSFDRFAFSKRVRQYLARSGTDLDELICSRRNDEVIDAIVSSAELTNGQLPKGLLEFHAYADGTRTAFEEHLLEATACLGARDGRVQSHFTVPSDSRDEFERLLQRFQAEAAHSNCEVQFSEQSPSTDTIALSETGALLRSEDQTPVLRPGGHGALIENLNSVKGDLIFVKNIDNVAHESSREASVIWIQALGGYLVRLQRAVHQHLHSLQAGDDAAVTAAFDFVQLTFPNAALPTTDDSGIMRQALTACLRRPLRVCGMVKNVGEPGGGPYWVREADGSLSVQIVESAEVDSKSAEQQAVFRQATHFNPVFMALAVRDESGEPFDLRQFVDADRVITTKKHIAGELATVLERPGLWNGAMARWNSVFVEVPMAVFSPVKSVLDLLRREHQPIQTMEPSAGA